MQGKEIFGLDIDLIFTFERWVEINLVILLSWFRIRTYQILWIRIPIRSMQTHITAFIILHTYSSHFIYD